MRKIVLIMCFFMTPALFAPQPSRANDAEIQQLVQNFFFNVANGYSSGTLTFLMDPMLSEKEGMLRNNPAYSDFLRKIYAGATMNVTNIDTVNDDTRTADVEIYFRNETAPSRVRYIIKNDEGRWKISDEVIP